MVFRMKTEYNCQEILTDYTLQELKRCPGPHIDVNLNRAMVRIRSFKLGMAGCKAGV